MVETGDTRETTTQDAQASASVPYGALVRWIAAALVVTAVVLVAVLVLANRPDWWRGLLAASIVSVLAAGLSLPVVAWGLRHGASRPELAAGAYFVSAAVRAGVSIGGAMVAVHVGDYPKAPSLLLVVPYYFAVLAAEATVMARWLWTTSKGGSTSPTLTDNSHA